MLHIGIFLCIGPHWHQSPSINPSSRFPCLISHETIFLASKEQKEKQGVTQILAHALYSFLLIFININILPQWGSPLLYSSKKNLSPDYCNTLIVWSNKLGTNPYSYCHIHPHLSQIAAQIETKRRTGGVWGL